MNNSFEKAFAFSILTAAAVLQVNAAEADTKPVKVVLDKVTVTATKTPIKVEEVPANVSITTSDDIKAKASATDAFKAIKHMAGIEPVSGGMSETLLIRGKVPSMLSNGKDMNFFSGGSQTPLVSMNSIERIEVLKGPQAAIHGAKATSGVVNIIRKKGDVDNPFIETGVFAGAGKQFGANLSLGGGTNFNSGGGGIRSL
ncbi:TonB-dependent siderophore receptor, partial [Campylobacter sp. RM16188]|uniref:TonB-dependent receptor plug domain-containing protein n=1 Tax=Campylobacter sp. RM16188 TaxID=1705725 RepID=UPI001557B7AF